jgi:hypothetical protein
MASFLSTVAALESSNFREILGLPAKEQLAGPEAFTLALQKLGVVRDPSWSLPQIVEALAETLGLSLGIDDLRERKRARCSPAAPAASAPAPAPAPARAASSTAATSPDFAPVPKANRQATLFETKGVTKFWLPKPQLKAASRAQAEGDAVSYEVLMEQVGIEAVTLPSEKALPPEQQVAVYGCDGCGQRFRTACSLQNHRLWKHPTKPLHTTFTPAKRPSFGGRISASLSVSAVGGVSLELRINGKDCAQLQREAEAEAQATEAATAERKAEANRRAHQRQQQRESDELDGEQRRGSAHRHQYSHTEKARLLDVLDQIEANPHASNKLEAFEADPRSRGCPYKTAHKWRAPRVRRQIAVGAAQDHAKSLLRFDKTSRKTGKYAPMETRLFSLFRERRARARKTSSRWLVHTARHIMRTEFTDEAAKFKGSTGWLQRFKRRKGIVTRKKTNVKNTTWEETEPVLQNYFRAFRRRLRDTEWRRAHAATAATARGRATSPPPPPVEPPTDGAAGAAARAAARAAWDAEAAAVPAVVSALVTRAIAAVVAAATTDTDPAASNTERERAATQGTAAEEQRGKWGKYLPHQRFNVDQVRCCQPTLIALRIA